MSKASYDGCITLDRSKNTVHIYRYVRYSNGQNDLLDNSTHNFDSLEDAMLFAEKMHTAYKADGVRLVIKDANILPSPVTQDGG
jgi:hypothetical protein